MIYYQVLRGEFSESEIEDIWELLNQLSDSPRSLAYEDFDRILNRPGFNLLVARDGERIVGMASLWSAEILMGRKAFIDDVVVLDSYRGRGIGEELIKHLIETAKSVGAKSVELTSNPSRVAANNLYQKLGFQKRDTNVYRLNF
ncbi:MAG: GNAT family N-acetyltransferase [Candidatus Harrisonbacteria bacterium]|nr:GNAT family N-acetyltransferase [Candidatus Harrisonbacteria bacterium]